MGAHLPWFRCFPDRLLGALAEMDADTQHVYAVVLLKIYARGGPVRNDVKALAAFCRRPVKSVATAVQRLVEMGRLSETENGLMNPVAETELGHQQQLSSVRSKCGKLGGAKKPLNPEGEKVQGHQGFGEANAGQKPTDKTKTKTEIREEEHLAVPLEPSPERTEPYDPAAAGRPGIVFQAGVIRLNAKDLSAWRADFEHLSLEAELRSMAGWAEQFGSGWYLPVQGLLARRNREQAIALERAKAEGASRGSDPIPFRRTGVMENISVAI